MTAYHRKICKFELYTACESWRSVKLCLFIIQPNDHWQLASISPPSLLHTRTPNTSPLRGNIYNQSFIGVISDLIWILWHLTPNIPAHRMSNIHFNVAKYPNKLCEKVSEFVPLLASATTHKGKKNNYSLIGMYFCWECVFVKRKTVVNNSEIPNMTRHWHSSIMERICSCILTSNENLDGKAIENIWKSKETDKQTLWFDGIHLHIITFTVHQWMPTRR